MSGKSKRVEEDDPKDSAVTETGYHGLLNIDWKGIVGYPFVMKYKFDENGFTLMVSTLTAVYGEKFNLDAIQKVFKDSNPFAEMLPKVMLKHLEKSLEIITEHEDPKLHIDCDPFNLSIEHQFNVKGVAFKYIYVTSKLPFSEVRAHILKPILLRALILDEEKAVLQRKVEELEGKHGSSSSNGCVRRNFKELYSAVDTCVIKEEFDYPESAFVKSFLQLQKNKICLPKSLESTPNVSPTKGVSSSSSNASLCNRLKDSKSTTKNILYNEDDSDVNLGFQNTKQESEEPEISCNMEKAEYGAQNLLDVNKPISPKKEMVKESIQNLMDANKPISPKREIAEEKSKGDITSMPSNDLKPSLAKKKKLLNF